jgi:ClpP class serine protease
MTVREQTQEEKEYLDNEIEESMKSYKAERVKMMRWRIVAFHHPYEEKSVVYKQNLTSEKLVEVVMKAIEKGANLMSIRGFEKEC